ncbi:hypothetical protein APHAL10511_008695, partial [Amanita phalloides]
MLQSSDNAIRTFFCLIEGDNVVFEARIGAGETVADLKEIIHKKGIERPILAKNLTLLMVDVDLNTHTRDSLRQLAIKEEDGIQMLDWTRVSEVWPNQPADRRLHIFVKLPPVTDDFKAPPQATISPSSSNESNAISDTDSHVLLGLRELHTHLWGEDRIVYKPEMACSILDLELFGDLCLNVHPDKILLIRNEYVLAYNYILEDTLKCPTTERQRSATLVTGQPGIGKTLFLFYVLARRLHERKPVAFQIDNHVFALFGQGGVTLHSTSRKTSRKYVSEGTWALSDSDASNRSGLCMAFQQPTFHVIHTSSPSSPRWKNWVKRLGADKYIMDVWSLEELKTLFDLKNLHFPSGKDLFEKYGPSPRVIIYLLIGSIKEETYKVEVKVAAFRLASRFSAVAPLLDDLDFGDISSKIFTVRPKNNVSRGVHTLENPTPFLCCTFGLAMSRQAAAQQHTFFRMLSSHPSFCAAGGWLFEDYAHNRLSAPNREPLKAHSLDGTVYHIPVPAKMIAGSTALKNIRPPHDFYWRPVTPNFKGVDAIIRSGDDVWVLQYTISREHKPVTDDLKDIHDGMNCKKDVKWHLVMIGSTLENAKEAWNNQKLGDGWTRETIVYASELPLGQFNELHGEEVWAILNK